MKNTSERNSHLMDADLKKDKKRMSEFDHTPIEIMYSNKKKQNTFIETNNWVSETYQVVQYSSSSMDPI